MKPKSLTRRSFFKRVAAAGSLVLLGIRSGAETLSRNISQIWVSLPTWLGGLELQDIPAVPIDPDGIRDSLGPLVDRLLQTLPSKEELTNPYTIGAQRKSGFEWMYGYALAPTAVNTLQGKMAAQLEQGASKNGATRLRSFAFAREHSAAKDSRVRAFPPHVHLDDPRQFSMGWTNFNGAYDSSKPWEELYAATFTDVEAATAQFWPTLMQGGVAFNLLLPQKVSQFSAGTLYVIDLTIFQSVQPHVIEGIDRFTPATQTWLWQDAATKQMRPIWIVVSGYKGAGRQAYSQLDPAWLYALQAAKTSITVYGIWLGHVYHWHIVSGAMQMTLNQYMPEDHPLCLLLGPQSKYNLAFNHILFLTWLIIGPPTSIESAPEFLKLCNEFARGRSYFDDDPKNTLSRLGLEEADFTVNEPWDQFPIVRHYLEIWDATERYVDSVVMATYNSDADVMGDANLQTWLMATRHPWGGNIRGIPSVHSRRALKEVLTSYLYRITAHGVSRFRATLFPALSFAGNFPPCLHKREIPRPQTAMTTRQLLTYMPTTNILGKYVNFFYFFIFSDPHERMIPDAGIGENLFYPGGQDDPRNQALIRFRFDLLAFATRFDPTSVRASQWPLNVET